MATNYLLTIPFLFFLSASIFAWWTFASKICKKLSQDRKFVRNTHIKMDETMLEMFYFYWHFKNRSELSLNNKVALYKTILYKLWGCVCTFNSVLKETTVKNSQKHYLPGIFISIGKILYGIVLFYNLQIRLIINYRFQFHNSYPQEYLHGEL